ncbi:MAG: FmdB family zinc ribbon protein [Actinomycetota bacterium]
MPTYEYECTACHVRSEAVQRFTDNPLTICTACGGALRKVFSAVGIVFKGGGFYKTDSRGASSASTPPASSSESSSASTPAAPSTPATPSSSPTPST